VEYLMAQEWAQTADDVLWRRSKLGLASSDVETLDRFMASRDGAEAESQDAARQR
jgi:glycerol-3-phosphate dehydrogenase